MLSVLGGEIRRGSSILAMKHPAVVLTVWTFETWFLLNLIMHLTELSVLGRNLFELFIRVWLYICLWWIFYYHIKWMQRFDV